MRIFITLLALTFSMSVFSQIGSPKSKSEIINVGEVSRWVGDNYSLYSLSYAATPTLGVRSYSLVFTNENTLLDNIVGNDMMVIRFTANQDDLDVFYNFLKNGFKADVSRTLEVGKSIVTTIPHSSGFLYIGVDFEDGSSGMLKLKIRQLDKLFGR